MQVQVSLKIEIAASASLTQMEQQIQQAGQQAMREALKQAIRQQEEHHNKCPHCGGKQRRLEGTVRRSIAEQSLRFFNEAAAFHPEYLMAPPATLDSTTLLLHPTRCACHPDRARNRSKLPSRSRGKGHPPGEPAPCPEQRDRSHSKVKPV